ncbi:hypothetical protein HA520_03810 [Azotobacter chroococcum]|uniref:Uncharacterized protein n=1 Tax=Azotobacter chroococcum TaxID=353 RepID=A0AA44C590_9GAMM|nr:hypothetical protein [Azotobacter chroococcum]NHN76414.1 hypothetical protein [Azotobacter chroococcum]
MRAHIFSRVAVCVVSNMLVGVSYAAGNYTEEKIECKLPGCQVSCAYKEANWKSFGSVDVVTMIIYDSGAIKLLLDKGIDGRTTIVTGPQGYMCSVENQRN